MGCVVGCMVGGWVWEGWVVEVWSGGRRVDGWVGTTEGWAVG